MLAGVPILKAASGIDGLDQVTGGGLPAGRPTLVCGGPGAGKTLLAVMFLVRGALVDDEPGVFVSFDERPGDLEANVKSLGVDLADLQARDLLAIDHIHIERHEIHETGEYDLEGLFIRLGAAVDRVRARRVVLDSVDTLFAGLPNEGILRAELRRLFGWLKDRDLSTVITTEIGVDTLTRHGIEEYVSDCVIVLDQRMQDELATRRLRIVKYRGSAHGSNEYPFIIDESGLSLLPVTAVGLNYPVSQERVSSGVEGLDAMLEGRGFYKGSSVLISGGPGTGKTSLAARAARAAVERGERCLYFAFEESEAQLVRNMGTVGIDLNEGLARQLLSVRVARPTTHGLEMHLLTAMHAVQQEKPSVVIIDPFSALAGGGNTRIQASMMSLRLIDFLKSSGVTAFYLSVDGSEDQTDLNISSLMDTWIMLTNGRGESHAHRRLYVVKSRGMSHARDVRTFEISASGVTVCDEGRNR
jgi:circadian clock protein KaiC